MANAAQALQIARSQIGDPYVYGAEGPNEFDCSGLVQFVMGSVGIQVPRTARQQQAFAKPVKDPLPGDLVFWGNPAVHVGIYIGNGQMIDAPHTGASVRVEKVYGTPSGYGRIPGLNSVPDRISNAAFPLLPSIPGLPKLPGPSDVPDALGLPSVGQVRNYALEGAFVILGLALVVGGLARTVSPSIRKVLG